MNLDSIVDFANQASQEIGKFMVPFTLSPQMLLADAYEINPLEWDSIQYGETELDKVPDDKRGVYAFAICLQSNVLPPHCYIMYIGIAGKDSERPLRDRYKDYLNERKVLKRSRIARMIGTWHEVLRFFFVPVDEHVSSDDLKKLELQLNTALMPPCSEGDLEADTKRKRRAFR